MEKNSDICYVSSRQSKINETKRKLENVKEYVASYRQLIENAEEDEAYYEEELEDIEDNKDSISCVNSFDYEQEIQHIHNKIRKNKGLLHKLRINLQICEKSKEDMKKYLEFLRSSQTFVIDPQNYRKITEF